MLPLRIALPHLEPFLADNVEKEARKDELVIRCAAEALARGAPPGAAEVRRLLAEARRIDGEFLARVGRFPVRIVIPYERIEPLRLRRIERGLDFSYRVLRAWQQGYRLRDAFPGEELERRVLELLALYADETRALSRSVRLPALLAPLRERLAGALHATMRKTAADIASHKRT